MEENITALGNESGDRPIVVEKMEPEGRVEDPMEDLLSRTSVCHVYYVIDFDLFILVVVIVPL
jgi:hypothetical protein